MSQNGEKRWAALRELCLRYPDWRLGQAVANVSGWLDANPEGISDSDLLKRCMEHLRSRFSDSPLVMQNTREDVFDALQELVNCNPERSLGVLVSQLAELVGTGLYDVEDEQLIQAARAALAVKELVA